MKKITLIALMILSAILIFAFSGCSSHAQPNEDAEKADKTAETVPPEQEETADPEEVFEDKLDCLTSSHINALCGAPITGTPENWKIWISMLISKVKPISTETVGDPLDTDFKETKSFSFDDLNKEAKYLFGMEIDFDSFKGKEEKYLNIELDFEERCVKSSVSFDHYADGSRTFSKLDSDREKTEITNVSENEDGTYTVDFSVTVRDYSSPVLDYYLGAAKYTARFSGKDDGYSVLRVDKAGDFVYSDFKPLGNEWLEENKGNGWFSKIDKSTVKDGRFVTEDRVMIEIRAVAENSSDARHKIADLLEKAGYSRYEFRERSERSLYTVLVKPEQIKEVAECDFVKTISFKDPTIPYAY